MTHQMVRSMLLLLLLSAVIAGSYRICKPEQLSADYPKHGVCGRNLVVMFMRICDFEMHASRRRGTKQITVVAIMLSRRMTDSIVSVRSSLYFNPHVASRR